MKVAESGMPNEKLWRTFFKPEAILRKMGVSRKLKDIADFGSGYGTFTLPAARIVSGTIYAIDIEKGLVESLRDKVKAEGIMNVKPLCKDIEAEGTGLKGDSVDYAIMFNILHGNHAKGILKEACRILKPEARAGIIHWNYDPATPRGPPMEIRLKPEQIMKTAEEAGFRVKARIDLKPHHYGIMLQKR
ncbi:MAG TPA: class I SAM-dependent methyltransferase [Candidatus Micrarchaeota archaeon]|nr:class I SAM-dependent methyltransferase [Candidatus Micrarchaeota archaeon]